MAALALEVKHRVDHVFDHAGSGDLAVLGDMTDQHHRGAACVWRTGQLVRGGADLADRPGRAFDVVGPHGLDRIDDREVGFLGFQRGQDVAQVGLGRQFHRGVGQPQPLRAHPHLRAGLLARDVEAGQAGAGEAGGGLQQQGRFADAGIAADQNGAGGHQTAAQHPVKFRDAGAGAGRRGLLGGKIGQQRSHCRAWRPAFSTRGRSTAAHPRRWCSRRRTPRSGRTICCAQHHRHCTNSWEVSPWRLLAELQRLGKRAVRIEIAKDARMQPVKK